MHEIPDLCSDTVTLMQDRQSHGLRMITDRHATDTLIIYHYSFVWRCAEVASNVLAWILAGMAVTLLSRQCLVLPHPLRHVSSIAMCYLFGRVACLIDNRQTDNSAQ